MKKVGIVPSATLFSSDNVYNDQYYIPNSYVARAVEAGMLPLGLLAVDGKAVKASLEECDCFILVGGNTIWPYHMQVIDHAVKTGKKLLGICLGCQCIHTYFKLAEKMQREGETGDVGEFWERQDDADVFYFVPVEGHEDDAKQKVFVKEGTLLHSLTGKTEIMGVSLHTYSCEAPAHGVVVSATAEDGTIEAIEYGKTILGTQFHPDADRALSCIFEFLAE